MNTYHLRRLTVSLSIIFILSLVFYSPLVQAGINSSTDRSGEGPESGDAGGVGASEGSGGTSKGDQSGGTSKGDQGGTSGSGTGSGGSTSGGSTGGTSGGSTGGSSSKGDQNTGTDNSSDREGQSGVSGKGDQSGGGGGGESFNGPTAEESQKQVEDKVNSFTSSFFSGIAKVQSAIVSNVKNTYGAVIDTLSSFWSPEPKSETFADLSNIGGETFENTPSFNNNNQLNDTSEQPKQTESKSVTTSQGQYQVVTTPVVQPEPEVTVEVFDSLGNKIAESTKGDISLTAEQAKGAQVKVSFNCESKCDSVLAEAGVASFLTAGEKSGSYTTDLVGSKVYGATGKKDSNQVGNYIGVVVENQPLGKTSQQRIAEETAIVKTEEVVSVYYEQTSPTQGELSEKELQDVAAELGIDTTPLSSAELAELLDTGTTPKSGQTNSTGLTPEEAEDLAMNQPVLSDSNNGTVVEQPDLSFGDLIDNPTTNNTGVPADPYEFGSLTTQGNLTFGPEIAKLASERTKNTVEAVNSIEDQLAELEEREQAGDCASDSQCGQVKESLEVSLSAAKSRINAAAFGDPLSEFEAYAISEFAAKTKANAEAIAAGKLSGVSGEVFTEDQLGEAQGDTPLRDIENPTIVHAVVAGVLTQLGEFSEGDYEAAARLAAGELDKDTKARFAAGVPTPEDIKEYAAAMATVINRAASRGTSLEAEVYRTSQYSFWNTNTYDKPGISNRVNYNADYLAGKVGYDAAARNLLDGTYTKEYGFEITAPFPTADHYANRKTVVDKYGRMASFDTVADEVGKTTDGHVFFDKSNYNAPSPNIAEYKPGVNLDFNSALSTTPYTGLSFGETGPPSLEQAKDIIAKNEAQYAADEIDFTSALSREDTRGLETTAEKLDKNRRDITVVKATEAFTSSAVGTAEATLAAGTRAFTDALSSEGGPTMAQAKTLDEAGKSLEKAKLAATQATIAAAEGKITEAVANRAVVREETAVTTGLASAVEDGPDSSKNRKTELELAQDFLWEAYQKSTASWKSKDVLAAQFHGMTVKDYVIGGIDPEFAKRMAAVGIAMEVAGIDFVINSGFRDDYRQELASGKKARTGHSHHGGSVSTDGYGHGKAVDINGTAAQQFVDEQGRKYGVTRPYNSPGSLSGFDDAPHVGPVENYEATSRGLGLEPGESLDDFAANASEALATVPNEGIPTAESLRANVEYPPEERAAKAAVLAKTDVALANAEQAITATFKAQDLVVDPAEVESVTIDQLVPESYLSGDSLIARQQVIERGDIYSASTRAGFAEVKTSAEAQAEIEKLTKNADDLASANEKLLEDNNKSTTNTALATANAEPVRGIIGRTLKKVTDFLTGSVSEPGILTNNTGSADGKTDRNYTPKKEGPAEVAAPVNPTKTDIDKRIDAINDLIGGQTKTSQNTDPLTGESINRELKEEKTAVDDVISDPIADAVVVTPVVVKIDDKKAVTTRPDLQKALEEDNLERFRDPYARGFLSPEPSTVLDDGELEYADGIFTEPTNDSIDLNHTYVYELNEGTRVIAPHTNPESSSPTAYLELASTLLETGGEGIVSEEVPEVKESLVEKIFAGPTAESFTAFDVTKVEYTLVPGPTDQPHTGTLQYAIIIDNRLNTNAALLGLIGNKEVKVALPEVTTLENATRIFGEAGFDGNVHVLLNMAEYVGEKRSFTDRLWDGLKGIGEWFDFSREYTTDEIISLTVYPNAVVSCPDIDGIENGYAYEVFVESLEDRDQVEVIRDTGCSSFEMAEIVEDIAGHLERKYGFVEVDPSTILDRTTENTAWIPFDPTVDQAQIIQPLAELENDR